MLSNIKWVRAYVIEMDSFCQRPVQAEVADKLVETGQVSYRDVSAFPFSNVIMIQGSTPNNIYFTLTCKK